MLRIATHSAFWSQYRVLLPSPKSVFRAHACAWMQQGMWRVRCPVVGKLYGECQTSALACIQPVIAGVPPQWCDVCTIQNPERVMAESARLREDSARPGSSTAVLGKSGELCYSQRDLILPLLRCSGAAGAPHSSQSGPWQWKPFAEKAAPDQAARPCHL